jgi:hypothetical protein
MFVEIEGYLKAKSFFGSGTYAGPKRVEETADVSREDGSNSHLAIEFERTRGNVRLVAELLCHTQYLSSRLWTYADPVMERTVDCSDGSAKSFRNLAYSRGLLTFICCLHRIQAPTLP